MIWSGQKIPHGCRQGIGPIPDNGMPAILKQKHAGIRKGLGQNRGIGRRQQPVILSPDDEHRHAHLLRIDRD